MTRKPRRILISQYIECGILRVRQPAQRAFERKRKGARITFFLPFQIPARKATSIECPFSPGMKTLLCFARSTYEVMVLLRKPPVSSFCSELPYDVQMDCHAHSSDRKKIHLVDMRILHSSAFQGHAARALYCS